MSVELHHVVEGPADAPPLVLLGALGTTLAMWEPQMEALAAEHRVVRLDLRGHGGSPVPPGPYELADLGGDVVATLDALGIERTHLCGLSLGAMVATWLAVHAAERIDRLVLCGASAALGPPSAWAQRAAIVREHGTEAIADAVVSRWLTPLYARERPEQVRWLRAMVAGTPAEGYAGGCAAIEHTDLEDDLVHVGAPTLVIAGADDPATPPDHAAHVAARVPGARMAVVPRAAHLANVQQPELVTELILRHLRA